MISATLLVDRLRLTSMTDWVMARISMKTGVAMLFLLGCASPVFAETWQYWSTWSATHDISGAAQVSALTEVYFRDGLSDDYVHDEYVTYSRKIGLGFSLAGQLYFESVQSAGNAWIGTRSAVAGVSHEADLPGICKARIEDRFFFRLNSPAEFDYHRPRVYLTRDIGPVRLTASDEMRVDLASTRIAPFYRNRVYAMASAVFFEATRLGLGYLRQSDRAGSSWKSFDGIQTLVAVTF